MEFKVILIRMHKKSKTHKSMGLTLAMPDILVMLAYLQPDKSFLSLSCVWNSLSV